MFTSYCEQLVLQFVPETTILILFFSLPVTLSRATQAHKICVTMQKKSDSLKKI